MRVLGYGLSFALCVGLLIFFFFNQTSVTVATPWATYHDAALWKLVLVAVAIGAVFTGTFAVAEGAQTRLVNRRLKRQIHKLETEINYLRTQQPVMPGNDTPAMVQPLARSTKAAGTAESPRAGEPPSRPIYESDTDDASPDPEDDIYTGGRAV